jgi:hypothetical protein
VFDEPPGMTPTSEARRPIITKYKEKARRKIRNRIQKKADENALIESSAPT